MTKHRAPLSVEQALQRIAGELAGGVDEMAQITGHAPGYIRALGDPGRRERLSVDDAIVLDIAYQAAGGVGAPVFEAYAYKLELAELDSFANQHSLGLLLSEITREAGEAHSAIALASLPGRSENDRRAAEKEAVEAIEALKRSLPLLAQSDVRPHLPP